MAQQNCLLLLHGMTLSETPSKWFPSPPPIVVPVGIAKLKDWQCIPFASIRSTASDLKDQVERLFLKEVLSAEPAGKDRS